VLIQYTTQVDNVKPMTPACREAYRYWGPLPSQSTTLWAYIAFRFLLVLVPLPEVLALSKKMAAESNRDLEVRHPFATLRTCPICPEEYFLLSVISAIHMENVTGYSALPTDLGLTGQLLALYIGVGTFGKALWHSCKQEDLLYQWLMYPAWSMAACAAKCGARLVIRGYEWAISRLMGRGGKGRP
jgi:hypothetical protein